MDEINEADRPVIAPMRAFDWEGRSGGVRGGHRDRRLHLRDRGAGLGALDADHLPGRLRLVAREEDGRIAGWASASRTSIRDVYRGVADRSVYVARETRGEGVGEPLLRALIEAADAEGLWTPEAVVFVENEASRRMAQSCGFRLAGRRERIGEAGGRWRDVLLFERRRPD